LGDIGEGKECGGSRGYVFRFRVKGQEHIGQIGEIKSNRAILFIWSSPIRIDLVMGQAEQIDLDGNNLAELEILLEKIENGKVLLLLKELKEGEEQEREEQPSVEPQPVQPPQPRASAWVLIIIAAIILVVIIVAIIIRSTHKKKQKPKSNQH
ncbi:MAG: hypothetical protein QXE64_00760, partial [Candidatus Pacearchaeota archaeon]